MITMRQLRRVRFVEVSENNVFVRGRRLSPQTFCEAEVAHRYRQSGTGSDAIDAMLPRRHCLKVQ